MRHLQNMETHKARIEYIDAMRGLTMLLVVYSHVCNYCLGEWAMGGNRILFLLRLPCFFFISGWLFYRAETLWDRETVIRTIIKKFRVQIVPTAIFLLLLAGPSLFVSRLGATKGGYWFTFALFEFFVIYLLSALACHRSRRCDILLLMSALVISAAAFAYDIYYNRYFANMGWATQLLGFLSFMTWRYYLFFAIGTLTRKHFARIEAWLDNSRNTWLLLLAVFIAMTLIPQGDYFATEYLRFSAGGVAGMFLVFTGFRRHSRSFCNDQKLGRALIYIGRRTLDIYLLHYFFLPRFLLPFGQRLQSIDSLPLEIATASGIALIVVALCLITSRVICLSPILGHILFGKNLKTEKA